MTQFVLRRRPKFEDVQFGGFDISSSGDGRDAYDEHGGWLIEMKEQHTLRVDSCREHNNCQEHSLEVIGTPYLTKDHFVQVKCSRRVTR